MPCALNIQACSYDLILHDLVFRNPDIIQRLANVLFIGGTVNFSTFRVCHIEFHSFVHRHIAHNAVHFILFYFFQKTHRFDSHLYHIGSCLVPGHGIHHLFSFWRIRCDILTHGERLIFQHWLKVCDLLTRAKVVPIVQRNCTTVNGSTGMKQMDLIDGHEFCYLL